MKSFDLSVIAGKLESLEETIIFRLIDRAQLALNKAVYEAGRFNFGDTKNSSLLDHKLHFLEETDAVLGRYTIAEERPFFQNLPKADENMKSNQDQGLFLSDLNIINLTKEIRESYVTLLPQIVSEEKDGEYGTTAECDIASLQAIARRIHYGSFYVAESKYRGNPNQYQELIDKKDSDALMTLLTRQEVEDRIIERIKNKVMHIQKISNPSIRRSINPSTIAHYYFDTIIPLTKVGEIAYLLNRREQ